MTEEHEKTGSLSAETVADLIESRLAYMRMRWSPDDYKLGLAGIRGLTLDLVANFAADNPEFDRDWFYQRAGVFPE